MMETSCGRCEQNIAGYDKLVLTRQKSGCGIGPITFTTVTCLFYECDGCIKRVMYA